MGVDLSRPEAVVRRYYVFRALAAGGFIAPVFALFVLRDLSYAEYGTLSAVYSLLLVGGEIPTGYVSDRFGRRDTLVASKVALAASLYGFLFAESFLVYLVLWVFWALGMALTSGTGSAWLYEVLESTLGADEFTAVRGKGNAIARWSAAGTMIAGSILYTVDPTYPFAVGGTVMLGGAAVIATLPCTEQFEDGETSGPSVRETVPLLRDRIARPPLRSFVLFVALLFGVAGAGSQYVQPIAVTVVENADPATLSVVGDAISGGLGALLPVEVGALLPVDLADLLPFDLPDVPVSAATGLGPLYATFAVVGATLSYYADAIQTRFGLGRVLAAVSLVVVATFLVPLAVPLAAFSTFYVIRGVEHLLRPMVEQYVNDRTGDVGRATVLSAVSMVFGLARTPFVVLAGLAAGEWGPVAAYGALAVLFLALAVPLALVGSPFPRGETSPSVAASTD